MVNRELFSKDNDNSRFSMEQTLDTSPMPLKEKKLNIVIRYVIKMRNGDYMVQNFGNNLDTVWISTVDNPIDADLIKSKSVVESVLSQILDGSSNLPVKYDNNNPPVEVIELKISVVAEKCESL